MCMKTHKLIKTFIADAKLNLTHNNVRWQEISPFLSSHVSSYHMSPTQIKQDCRITGIQTGDLAEDFFI